MTYSAGCWMRRLAGLAIATSWLGSCATAGSEPPVVAVGPPVVEYSAEFRAQAAGELELPPEGSAVGEMLGDYAVMREQARACRRTLVRGKVRKTLGTTTATAIAPHAPLLVPKSPNL